MRCHDAHTRTLTARELAPPAIGPYTRRPPWPHFAGCLVLSCLVLLGAGQAHQYPQSILSPKEQAATAAGGGQLFQFERDRSKRTGWFLGAAVAR